MSDYYETRVKEQSSIVRRDTPALFGEDGYMIIPNFYNVDVIEEVRFKVDKLKAHPDIYKVMEPGKNIARSILNVHGDYDVSIFLDDYRLELMVSTALNCAAYIHQSRVNFKDGKQSTGWHWHSDFETWHYQDGMPLPDCFTATIPLDDNTEENGCLQVIPGSHNWYISTKKGSDSGAVDNFANQVDGVPETQDIQRIMQLTNTNVTNIICNKGDLVIFDSNLLHKSEPNRTDGTRANLYFVINSINNQLQHLDNPRPEEMAHRKNLRII